MADDFDEFTGFEEATTSSKEFQAEPDAWEAEFPSGQLYDAGQAVGWADFAAEPSTSTSETQMPQTEAKPKAPPPAAPQIPTIVSFIMNSFLSIEFKST